MSFTPQTPVRDIVTEYPATVPALERLGIDYCCGGAKTLTEACARRNIAVAEVIAQLERQSMSRHQQAWPQTSLRKLCGHITSRHHVFTRQQLQLIDGLLDKVRRRHGANHPELVRVAMLLSAIEAEIEHHFHCEENVLFPYIAQLEENPGAARLPMFQSIHHPVHRMLAEHDQTGEKLRSLREETNHYQPPSDACTTFRALWKALEDLEKDMHLHIHLENNILFPRALSLAEQQPYERIAAIAGYGGGFCPDCIGAAEPAPGHCVCRERPLLHLRLRFESSSNAQESHGPIA